MGGGLIVKKKVRFAKISMENDIHALRRIIPRCEEVDDVENLLLKSIEYVIKLKLQVNFLRTLSNLYGVL
ncbi:hypothetical protein HS088_TW23G00635 [Tripterygium wilfordii]|uniref:Uncharacterized protein n=1 Tax=Tripterygium wilfordii TaxID=458696 RepID=A0A7J7BVJ4_TRIWF|nr:hypothetical protein HS088_TW23G00635 [Tripterygium wilfordii]